MEEYLEQKVHLEKLVRDLAIEHGFQACNVGIEYRGQYPIGLILSSCDWSMGRGPATTARLDVAIGSMALLRLAGQ